jgi:hypothetical protein
VPVALQYLQDGQRSQAAAFVGEMTLLESVGRVLVAPRLVAQLRFLPPVPAAGRTRQAVAQDARVAIGQALDLPLVDAASLPWQAQDELNEARAGGGL